MIDTSFPFPTLVADIGGTNVRFALQPSAKEPLEPAVHLKTWDYPNLAEAIEAAIPNLSAKPKTVIACGAGPVEGRELQLTNAPWRIKGPEVLRRLGLGQGLLLNDFEAQALSLPILTEDWARNIGPVAFGVKGPQVILGPGTGLGIGALIHVGDQFTPLSSEACHIGFGPETEEEWAIWPHLERAHGRVTTESVISGPGLVRVHRARLAAAGLPASDEDGPTIVDAALADRQGEEAKSLRLFWRIVGRLAGDMAVVFVAFGGVTLAGGVLPRIVDFLDEVEFRHAFEAKAPVDALARRIPTRLVTRSDSVLFGMAAIAARPETYAIEYRERAWA
jgi:glucokinase